MGSKVRQRDSLHTDSLISALYGDEAWAATSFLVAARLPYAREIQRLVEQQGGQREAARVWGVPQSLVSKVIRRTVRTVPFSWVEKIHSLPVLVEEDRRLLDGCLISSQAAALLAQGAEWTKAELSRFGVALSDSRYKWASMRGYAPKSAPLSRASVKARHLIASSIDPIGNQAGPAATAVRARSDAERLHGAAIWSTLEEIYSMDDLGIRGTLYRFEKELSRRGFGREDWRSDIRDRDGDRSALAIIRFLDPRGILAILRSVEPLADASPSGFGERSWTELKAKELRQFLELSRKRELILLNREPNLPRAQRQAARMFLRSPRDAAERRERALARKFGPARPNGPSPRGSRSD